MKVTEEGVDISPEERARIERASRQLVSYANFLRWAANFKRTEMVRHNQHDKIMLLSVVQSGRFSFAIDGDTLFIGVQKFEAVWMLSMPFSSAYVSDRLYLSVDSVTCIDSKLPSLVLGIFVDSASKRRQMQACKQVQLIRVDVLNGAVDSVGGTMGGLGFALTCGEIVARLKDVESDKQKQLDMSRFF